MDSVSVIAGFATTGIQLVTDVTNKGILSIITANLLRMATDWFENMITLWSIGKVFTMELTMAEVIGRFFFLMANFGQIMMVTNL